MTLPPLWRYQPILDWGRRYNRSTFTGDMVATVIVTIMLIPQSLAYALLAGIPPEVEIYASVALILLYAIFGTSRALAVGPVAVVSLMTAAAVGKIAQSSTAGYVTAALTLSFLTGAMLLALGLFRLGFLANFLSHPVIAGFITASGIPIAASQLRHILGLKGEGHALVKILGGFWAHLDETKADHRHARRLCDRLHVLGPERTKAAPAPLWSRAPHGRHWCQDRPGAGNRCHDAGSLDR